MTNSSRLPRARLRLPRARLIIRGRVRYEGSLRKPDTRRESPHGLLEAGRTRLQGAEGLEAHSARATQEDGSGSRKARAKARTRDRETNRHRSAAGPKGALAGARQPDAGENRRSPLRRELELARRLRPHR